MKKFFAVCVASAILLGSPVVADTDKIFAALEAVANSQEGEEIAHGLVEIGRALNTMSVDDTIAFRNSIHLLVSSKRVSKGTPPWDMLERLWEQTTQHLILSCGTNPTREVARKINLTIGRKYRCKVR